MRRSLKQYEKRIEYLQDCLGRDPHNPLVTVDGNIWWRRHVWGCIKQMESDMKWI